MKTNLFVIHSFESLSYSNRVLRVRFVLVVIEPKETERARVQSNVQGDVHRIDELSALDFDVQGNRDQYHHDLQDLNLDAVKVYDAVHLDVVLQEGDHLDLVRRQKRLPFLFASGPGLLVILRRLSFRLKRIVFSKTALNYVGLVKLSNAHILDGNHPSLAHEYRDVCEPGEVHDRCVCSFEAFAHKAVVLVQPEDA